MEVAVRITSKQNFQDSFNPVCSCSKDTETSAPFLLLCGNYSNERSASLNIIGNIDTEQTFTCSMSTKETLEKGMKYNQS